jgi:cytochrome P450
MSQLVLILAVAAAVLGFKFYKKRIASPKAPYPPGPPGEFLIGNLRQVPHKYAWSTFTEWGRKYGPLTYLEAAHKPLLIINRHEVAIELLEKRAAIYSDRPRFVMTSELCGLSWGTAVLGYGPVLKKHRQMLTQALNPRAVQTDFVPLQERNTYKFARSLLDDPANFYRTVHRLSGEIIQTITYGACYDGNTDLVELGAANMVVFGKASAGYLVDLVPFLRHIPDWFPGAQFKRDAKEWRAITKAAMCEPFAMVKRQRATGEAVKTTFTSTLLDRNEETGGGLAGEEVIAGTAASLFGGGSDTLAGTTLTFILAMTRYPGVQAKAQAEIDRVIGTRCPTLADKASLPYLGAILLETLRWHPVAPIGIPHRLVQDDIYSGYLIPSGTQVIVNVWGILHDESRFPDPFEFRPERYLPLVEGGVDAQTAIDPWTISFGYGRRVCPGVHVAQSGLWMALAMLLSSFNIKPKTDPRTGKLLVPEAEWTGDFLSHPKPFECDITPRSKDKADWIRDTVAEDVKAGSG